MLQIVWFKRDLRVEDNGALWRAAGQGPVLPLYIVEPGFWTQPDASGRHWAFLRETLRSLRDQLAGLGQPLVVRRGAATEVLGRLLDRYPVGALWSHQETGNAWTFERDRAVQALMRERGIPWHQQRQFGVVRGSAERDRWSRQWESLMSQDLLPLPKLQPLSGLDPGSLPRTPVAGLGPDPCPGRQRGGRAEAERTLQGFLQQRGACYYLEMSSPLSADKSCSRLSAHLSLGSLSMRELVQATRRRRAEVRQLPPRSRATWARALAAFEGRLHWHCHFIQKLESEPRIEWENMQRATQGLRPEPGDPERLGAWMRGETGWPFVDACMRYLGHTGWINFRMRAMLMSVASYQLWLPWRETGLHLARRFLDYEPGIHWPQVQMQSGTTGINTLRIYNPQKQSMDQDPEGSLIRTWVPELAPVDTAWVHSPWLMPESEQRRCGVRIGSDYPAPLVEHQAAAREARQRIQQARRAAEARAESKTIYQRHGSRKRPPHRAQAEARNQPGSGQGELFGDGS